MPKFTRTQTVDAYQFLAADWNSDQTREIPSWVLQLLSSGAGAFNGAGQLQVISGEGNDLKKTVVNDTDWIIKFGLGDYGVMSDILFSGYFQPAPVDLTTQPAPVITAAPSA
jgi:hypothetical protein